MVPVVAHVTWKLCSHILGTYKVVVCVVSAAGYDTRIFIIKHFCCCYSVVCVRKKKIAHALCLD